MKKSQVAELKALVYIPHSSMGLSMICRLGFSLAEVSVNLDLECIQKNLTYFDSWDLLL